MINTDFNEAFSYANGSGAQGSLGELEMENSQGLSYWKWTNDLTGQKSFWCLWERTGTWTEAFRPNTEARLSPSNVSYLRIYHPQGVFAVRARCDAGRHRDFKPDQQADGRVHKYRKLKPEEAMIFDIGSGGGQALRRVHIEHSNAETFQKIRDSLREQYEDAQYKRATRCLPISTGIGPDIYTDWSRDDWKKQEKLEMDEDDGLDDSRSSDLRIRC
ncbi:hypothetical protein V8E54_009400 [Elaphomyces granulatus]